MRAACLLPLMLSACIGGGTTPPRDAPVFPVAYDTGGIDVVGSGQRIDFGRAEPGVIDTMSRLLGDAPTRLPCDRSDRSAARWSGGPLLIFQNGSFVGWSNEGATAGEACTPISVG